MRLFFLQADSPVASADVRDLKTLGCRTSRANVALRSKSSW